MPFPLHWHTEPFLLITILFFGWGYAICVGPLRERLAPLHTPYPYKQACLFYAGLLLTYLTVGSPLDQIGEDFLFSAHMVQHMLLIYALPPMFILGTPHWLVDQWLSKRILYKICKVAFNPAFAGFTFTFLYTVWHIPTLYELALNNKTVHVIEHISMFLPGLCMWWALLSLSHKIPRSAYGVRMLYVFLLMIGQLPVFGFLTLSEEILYPTYEFAPRITSMDPLEDQIIGGLIMKITNMLVSLFILCVCFYQWYQADANAPEATIQEKQDLAIKAQHAKL